MDPKKDILAKLKEKGARLTKTRSLMVAIFQEFQLPITGKTMLEQLARRGARANKTTVYRELDYLLVENVIRGIDFGDGVKRFELKTDNHHHHLVCLNCQKVDDIPVTTDVGQLEHKINQQKKFKVSYHSLEFFGLCKKCQSLN